MTICTAKIAYFSPFPPKQSGIALYSDQLVPHLRQVMDVDCFDFWNQHAGDSSTAFSDFGRAGRVKDLGQYDAVIYHLGNNPHVHLDILRTLQLWPGIVVLHDIVLYYLFAGFGRAGLIKYLWLVEGRAGADSIDEITSISTNHDILRYPHPEHHPLTPALFPYATRIVVHNAPAKRRLVEQGYTGTVEVIPHLAFSRTHDANVRPEDVEKLRRRHGLAENEIVIGCFGYIGPSKRLAQVCRALGKLRKNLKFCLLIVGEGENVRLLIQEAGLSDVTIRTGFVEAAEYSRYLALTDILINLRYPSMGESSATLTRAMQVGKPAIVTRDAAFGELPDDAVYKIDVGPSEEKDLATAVSALAGDPELRRRMGESGRRYVQTALDPTAIARQFQHVVEADSQSSAETRLLADAASGRGADRAANLLRRSIQRSVPPHVQQRIFSRTGASES